MELTSPAFAPGHAIPPAHTCDGADASPPLAWSGVPEAAKTLALIVDDPDAPRGSWLHWTLWDLPPRPHQLAGGVPPHKVLPSLARQGVNDFGNLGWGGPCPPAGTHRYVFRLYALDAPLALAAGASRRELEAAMQGHVLAQAELMGTYHRTR